MNRRLRIAGFALALVAPVVSALAATPPVTVNYQGVLRNASDKPLSGTYDMTFRFYDALSGGNEILVDTHAAAGSGAVTVSNGLFNTLLGGGTVTDGAGSGTYTNLGDVFRDFGAVYVQIRVGAETLSPRIKVHSSAYALNATNLGGKAATQYLDTSSTSQAKSGPLTISAPGVGQIGLYSLGGTTGGWFKNGGNTTEAQLATSGGYGVYASGPTSGGYFVNSVNSTNGTLAATDYVLAGTGATGGAYLVQSGGASQTRIAYSGFGVYANGNTAGGYFSDGSDSSYLATGTYGIRAFGSYMGGYVSNTVGNAYAQLGLNGGYGVLGYGSTSGGFFKDNTTGAYAYVGNAGFGIKGYGTGGGAFFQDTDNDSRVYAAYGLNGVYAIAPSAGGGVAGYFTNTYPVFGTAYAALGTDSNSAYGGPFAIKAVTNDAYGTWPGDFVGSWSGVFTRVANNTFSGNYKVYGNGSVSFVQNYPADPSKLIVYTAPEGDETAVYTRGTARLVAGEARVTLGETFKWVANPDIGLTAQITPRGTWSDLYVASVTTDELVVRSRGGTGDGAFDYAVWGLRIGFEETQVLTKKTHEAMIPSMSLTRRSNADSADLAEQTALERFRRMDAAAFGLDAGRDLSRAKALHDAIGEYDPNVDSKMRQELMGDPKRPAASRPEATPTPSSPPAPGPAPAAQTRSSLVGSPLAPDYHANAALAPVAGQVEAGDVLANDPDRVGELRLSSLASDPAVVGIVGGEPGMKWSDEAPVVFAGAVALCRVDASYGAIAPGDLLVASATPGHAMRAGKSPAPGTIVGKALEPLDAGQALIRVLAMAR